MFTRSLFNYNQTNTADKLVELESKLQSLTLENKHLKNEVRKLTNKSKANTISIRERLNNIESELLSNNPIVASTQQTPIIAIPVTNTTSSPRPFNINDHVKIRNPKKKQSNTGTVIGYTATGFVKILLDNNQGTVRRIPSNLTVLQPRF